MTDKAEKAMQQAMQQAEQAVARTYVNTNTTAGRSTQGISSSVVWGDFDNRLGIEPHEGALALDEQGNLLVYRNKVWSAVTQMKLPEPPLAEIDLDALNTDIKTIKREVSKRVLWLEEKADNMNGKERLQMEDAIHYLRSAIEELDKIREQR